jgi:hypothetical protein
VRLAIAGVGAALIVVSIITGNQPSGIYPSEVFIGPVLPVVAGIALVVRQQRERRQIEQSHSVTAVPVAPATLSDSSLVAAARDPNTPLEKLANLAYDHPELRSAIAENPSTYPDLLGWLEELGDPAVAAALARRNS